MPILSTLRQDKAGDWPNLGEFLKQVRHRETQAVAALGNALGAPSAEQKELAEAPDAGFILLEIACDLRIPRTSRLAAARCLLEAGIEEPHVGHLFIGGGDLVTDPRLGAQARKMAELGLPSAAKLPGPVESVTLEAAGFARGIASAASVLGNERVKELLKDTDPVHAGVAAGLFAIGAGEIPAGQIAAWKQLLEATCRKAKSAPAAAKRLGLAPPWPPNVPDAFAPMIKEAEEKASGVVSRDAAANPEALKKPAPPAAKPPVGEFAQRGAKAASPPGLPPPKIAEGKTLAPPIRRSPFRQPPPSQKAEKPVEVPAKPMEEVKGRITPGTAVPPENKGANVGPKDETIGEKQKPLAVPPSKKTDEIRFDPRGKRLSREDRWDEFKYEWPEPVLPPPTMPPPAKVAVAPGPLAQRIASIFEDRPEAVERLCAAAEVQVARNGEEQLKETLLKELARKQWQDRKAPPEQLARLRAVAGSDAQPGPWRFAATLLLEKLG